ncbi:hypothetical protein [Insolitispirillum peregrinum]|uniref:hypothetical protein n=1 Tax=Insolitispirillum peregrinum TaxID=80876 RepID=UPI003614AED0
MSPDGVTYIEDDEVSFFDLICIAFRRKRTFLISISVCFVMAFIALRFNSPEYTARLMIRPLAAEDSLSATQGLSLSGGLLGQTTDENIALYIGTMSSVEMMQRAISQRGLAQLVQPNLWDGQKKEWIPPSGLLAAVRAGLNSLVDRSWTRDPADPVIVGGLVSKMITVDRADNKLTPNIYAVMVKAKSPDMALNVLTILHEETISVIRENKIRNAQALLNGLRKRYTESTEIAYRSAFLEQIMRQEKRLLMLQDPQYPIIDLVDPPSFASAPQVIPIGIGLAAGLLAGFSIAFILNILLYLFKGRKTAGT